MSFWEKLFGKPNTTTEELNAVLEPLGNTICDFKDATGISWAAILPAASRIGTTMLVGSRGQRWTLGFLDHHLKRLEKKSAVPAAAVISMEFTAQTQHIAISDQYITSQVGVKRCIKAVAIK